jgi:hypothetical protein
MCDEKQRNRENLNLSPLRLPFRHIGADEESDYRAAP